MTTATTVSRQHTEPVTTVGASRTGKPGRTGKVAKAEPVGPGSADGATDAHLNLVRLRGRLAAPAERRELPSGDLLTVFRLIIDRPAGARGRVDTIDCATASGRVRQCIERAGPGELIAVEGQLRRRFWRGPAGPTSRYEVEATTLARVAPPPRSSKRPTGRRSGS